jgi:hypothetical protein
MRQLLRVTLFALVAIAVTASPVYAQNVRIRGVSFSLSLLEADGTVQFFHLDPEDVTVVLLATGKAEVTCPDDDEVHLVPVETTGTQFLSQESFNDKGSSPFHVEASEPTLLEEVPCDDDDDEHDDSEDVEQDLEIGFVFWNSSTIQVVSGDVTETVSLSSDDEPEHEVLAETDYQCKTNEKAHRIKCRKDGHDD